MRIIRVSGEAVQLAASGLCDGQTVCVPVQVDWAELRLTESQIFANAAALMSGEPEPYPDQRIFVVELPVVPRGN